MPQAFISWSGSEAKEKARALRKLIADVLPEAAVFMSDEDIAAGSLWLEKVTGSLDDAVAGVIIVTEENLKAPWIHYEAGALATRVTRRMVIPLLSGLSPSDLANTPLSNFQALSISKDSVLEVITSFASALGISRQGDAITRSFNKWWDEYEADITVTKASPAKQPANITDVYRLLSNVQGQLRVQGEAISAMLSTGTWSEHPYPAHVLPLSAAQHKAAFDSHAAAGAAASASAASASVAQAARAMQTLNAWKHDTKVSSAVLSRIGADPTPGDAGEASTRRAEHRAGGGSKPSRSD